jgi:rare lipoprotein A
MKNTIRRSGACGAALALLLAACASQSPKTTPATGRAGQPAPPDQGGPRMTTAPMFDAVSGDAIPRKEPLAKYGNPDKYVALGKTYKVMKDADGYSEEGIASWYGRKFHGQRTSSGELYDMFKMTAAHPNLPLPTYLRVTNVDNGRSVVVRVNDRGPFHDDRVIDLSYAAASRLDLMHGTGKVHLEAITSPSVDDVMARQEVPLRPTPAPTAPARSIAVAPSATQPVQAAAAAAASRLATASSSARYLQVAAFVDPINAVALREELQERGFKPLEIRSDGIADSMHRVLVGPIADRSRLASVRTRLEADGMSATPFDPGA